VNSEKKDNLEEASQEEHRRRARQRDHIHTYIKYKGRPRCFRCDDPDCYHYLDKEAGVEKRSLCSINRWSCHTRI
jgi:hypothetical protein